MSQLLELEVVKNLMKESASKSGLSVDTITSLDFIADSIITLDYLDKQVYPMMVKNNFIMDNLQEFFDSKNLEDIINLIGRHNNLKFFIELVSYIRKTWSDDKTMDYHHAVLRGELNTFYAHELPANVYHIHIDYTLDVLREEFGEKDNSPDLNLEQMLAFLTFQMVNDSSNGIKFNNIKDALVSPEDFAKALEEI